ncbi:MAG TPA: methyltransferase domain-containing protein [Acidimicrobiales bacterium]|nr:methyltransferase domain-containing protein [Acidimicrobiales bacterium]
MGPADAARSSSYGQSGTLTTADRLGTWLSGRRVRKEVGSFAGKAIGDFGCGYHARLARSVLEVVDSATLVDVALADDLKVHPKVRAIEGTLPDALAEVDDASLDVVLCVSVLEHLWHPEVALGEFRRIVRRGGVCLVNVPSWRGKRFLELSAFRLGLSPAEEMDDHKWYFDPRDLWPLLVRAGFLPHDIRCRAYKFGLNTFAACRVS